MQLLSLIILRGLNRKFDFVQLFSTSNRFFFLEICAIIFQCHKRRLMRCKIRTLHVSMVTLAGLNAQNMILKNPAYSSTELPHQSHFHPLKVGQSVT